MQTIEKIIDISDGPARLSVKYSQVVIKRGDSEEAAVAPLNEIAALLVSHPAVTYTNAVLSGICANGGIFVLCNEKRMPAGMLLPLENHYVQAERFSEQTQASVPLKKRLWKEIITAKVSAQGRLLSVLKGKDEGLSMLASRVQSGDSSNIEAQAARRYWSALFGEDFSRDADMEGPNALLNYGYAVLRASTARAICAAGLHPSFGLHHHNKYDSFRLADDLMEPFRPVVDETVYMLIKERGHDAGLDKQSKAFIVSSIIDKEFLIEDEWRGFFDTLSRTASSLAAVYLGKRKSLLLME